MRTYAGLLGAIVALASLPARADEVLLRSGGRIRGIATVQGERVVVEMKGGTVRLDRSDVVAIDRSKWSVIQEYYRRFEAIRDSMDPEDFCALARWAKENGILRHARWLNRRVKDLDPDHPECVSLPERKAPRKRPEARRARRPKPFNRLRARPNSEPQRVAREVMRIGIEPPTRYRYTRNSRRYRSRSTAWGSGWLRGRRWLDRWYHRRGIPNSHPWLPSGGHYVR